MVDPGDLRIPDEAYPGKGSWATRSESMRSGARCLVGRRSLPRSQTSRRTCATGDAAVIRRLLPSAPRFYHLDYLGWLAENREWLDRTCRWLTAAAAPSCLDYIGDVDWRLSKPAKDCMPKSRPGFRTLLTGLCARIEIADHYVDLDFGTIRFDNPFQGPVNCNCCARTGDNDMAVTARSIGADLKDNYGPAA